MSEEEWAALSALSIFETITFARAQRRRTLVAATAQQVRELIERAGDVASVEVSRPEVRKYIVKLIW